MAQDPVESWHFQPGHRWSSKGTGANRVWGMVSVQGGGSLEQYGGRWAGGCGTARKAALGRSDDLTVPQGLEWEVGSLEARHPEGSQMSSIPLADSKGSDQGCLLSFSPQGAFFPSPPCRCPSAQANVFAPDIQE